jgi:hypothetical protein
MKKGSQEKSLNCPFKRPTSVKMMKGKKLGRCNYTNTNTNTLLNLSTPVVYNSNNNIHYYNELANIGHLNNLNGIMGNMGHWIRIG